MDGRDIGTVIAPDATAKLFVDARARGPRPSPLAGAECHGHRAVSEAERAGRTRGPRRRRPRARRLAPEAGRRRRLARYLRFGYRRRVRGSPCSGGTEDRGISSKRSPGVEGDPASLIRAARVPNPNQPNLLRGWLSRCRAVARKSVRRSASARGRSAQTCITQEIAWHKLPLNPSPPPPWPISRPCSKPASKASRRRKAPSSRAPIVAIENDFAVVDVGLKTEGRVALKEFSMPGQPRQHQCRRRGRGLSRARRERDGRSRAQPRQGAPRGKLDPSGEGLQRRRARQRRDLRPRQGRLHRRSRRRGGVPSRQSRSMCARCAMSAR